MKICCDTQISLTTGALVVRVAMVIFTIFWSSFVAAQSTENVVTEQYENWSLVCQSTQNEAGQRSVVCDLSQTLGKDEIDQGLPAISFTRYTDRTKPNGVILAPLGSDIWMGMYLETDEYVTPNIGYNTCLPIGCIALFYADPPLIDQLRAGKDAFLSLYQYEVGDPVRVRVSSAGFDSAWNRLLLLTGTPR